MSAPLPDVRRGIGWLAREHPGLVVSIVYVVLTLIGMGYDVWLYHWFRINILEWAQTGDFLLAAVRSPLVVVLCVVPLSLVWLFRRLNEVMRARTPRLYKALGGGMFDRSPIAGVITYALLVIVYASLFTELYAAGVSARIKSGNGRRAHVAVQNGPALPDSLMLIGTTTQYTFLYAPAERRTHIVPVENIASIVVESRRPRRSPAP